MQKLSVTSDHANMMFCMMYVAILVLTIHDKTNIWNKKWYITKNQVEFDIKYHRISYAITFDCCSFSRKLDVTSRRFVNASGLIAYRGFDPTQNLSFQELSFTLSKSSLPSVCKKRIGNEQNYWRTTWEKVAEPLKAQKWAQENLKHSYSAEKVGITLGAILLKVWRKVAKILNEKWRRFPKFEKAIFKPIHEPGDMTGTKVTVPKKEVSPVQQADYNVKCFYLWMDGV